MLIEIIVGGLSTIASVTTILQNRQSKSTMPTNRELAESLLHVQRLIVALQAELSGHQPVSPNPQAILDNYNQLLEAIRANNLYSPWIEFRQTDYGTWQIIRKKPTVLRDPEGEYGAPESRFR